ncbi:MAG: hypothetical protein HYR63_18445 [Proteobacteria bacterium]|nr:hypothetical protein [Pseudomonadota bacterium]MBI3499484.1 hypothetical protein [Pseudomonadota bacterium]
MLPSFPASSDANGNLLVQSRLAFAESGDLHLRPTHHPPDNHIATSVHETNAGNSSLEVAAWAAFARGLGLARDSVYDVVRAIGLEPSVAHAVADQVTEIAKTEAGAHVLAGSASQEARLTLAFKGVSVEFAGAGGKFQLKVQEVSLKASGGGAGSAGGEAHFGEAKVAVKAAQENLKVSADGGQLQARFAELGTSLDATVSVGSFSDVAAASSDNGLGLSLTGADGSQSWLGAGAVTGLSFDLAVPLPSSGGLSLVAGGNPVNVTV